MATIGSSTLLLLLLLLSGPLDATALELGLCGSPLGMESGAIKDSAISASSAYDSSIVGPQHGRLRTDKNGGAWCPRQMVSKDAKEYLQVDLDELHVVTGTRTQGRFGNGQGQEYAEEYMIDYWRPGFVKWARWKDREAKSMLPGNTNTYTIVDQKLDPPVIASKVRFLPYSDHVRTVCMRVELLGCKWTDGLISYSVPQGSSRGTELDLTDRTYDGTEHADVLSGGLGQLVDGQKGQDNFKLDLSGYGKGYEWVGWRNDTPGWSGEPLEMLFEFDRVRNFSAVHIHINNMFTKDVQVFSHARVYFSVGGNLFNGEPVRFSYMPDLALEHARNVTIKLHHRFGRFLKIQLYFASVWMLISEISFDSAVLTGNYTELEEDVRFAPDPSNPEYPLQRDEVKLTSNKSNRNSTEKIPVKNIQNEETSHYIGFVIGLLTVIILILVAAIVFIVFRNQKLKALPVHSAIPHTNNESDKGVKLRSNESDKSSLYHQNCNSTLYNQQSILNSPDYIEVPDVVCAEYALPGYQTSIRHSIKSSTCPPPLINFLPKPPKAPPPDDYNPGSEISTLPLMTPPLSPHKMTYSRCNRNFFLPAFHNEEGFVETADAPVFRREHLRIVEKLGEEYFEDVHLCECLSEDGKNKSVVVYTLRLESLKPNFEKEVLGLARIKHENVSQLLGACLDNEPIFAVREFSENGDLCQFLQDHVAETASSIVNTASTLSYGCLIYMATQIAAGMKYLESLRYVHKDLATRNCLVASRFNVKISDVGCYRQIYAQDYYQVDSFRRLPIRWLAWESILLNKFTTKSDVWSFAILLWEILSFAREQPFEDLSDEKVIENVSHFYQDDKKHVLPDMPIGCTKEIYDLMCECWQRNESDRPNFHEIHLFLQRKNLGYSPEAK